MWGAALLGIVVDWPVLSLVTVPLFLAYLAYVLATSSWENWAPTLVTGGAVAALTLLDGSWGGLWNHLHEAVILIALIATLQFLKQVAARDPRMRRFRHRLEALPEAERPAWLLIAANALAGVLGSGAPAVLSPALPVHHGPALRRSGALAVIGGSAFASAWSPIFVALAVVAGYAPDTPIWKIVLVGLCLSVIGLGIALSMLGVRKPLAATAAALVAIAPVLPLVGAGGAAVVLFATATGSSTLEATSLVLPALAILLVASSRRPLRAAATAIGRMARLTLHGIARGGGEIGLVSVAFVLARTIATSPTSAGLLATLGLSGVPGPLSIAAVSGGIFVLAFIGIHPIIAASVGLALFVPDRPDVLPEAMLGAALLGWSSAAMVSFTGFLLVSTTTLLDIRRHHLIFGRNILIALAYLLAGTAFLIVLSLLAAPS